MHKRNIVIVAGILFVIAAVTVFMLTGKETESISQAPNTPTDPRLIPNYFAEALQTPSTGACLEADESISIKAEERMDIEYASMAHLIDVPAGTNVDIYLATYSESEVTGSDRYSGEYGSYNFTLTKQDGDWSVTAYQRCEP